MANEYLLKEYEICIEQLRFYDKRHIDLIKYILTLGSIIATAQFAIFRYFQSATQSFFIFQAILSFVVFMASILIYVALLHNRLYFVFMARQINAIRLHLMATMAPDFKDNQLWTNINIPAFRLNSIHTVHILGAVLISSFFACETVYAILSAYYCIYPILISAIIFIIIIITEFSLGAAYLQKIGNKTADQFITKNMQS